MKRLLSVLALAFGLAFVGVPSAVAQTVVDFDDLSFTAVCGQPGPFTSQGVTFEVTANGCMTIYACPECGFPATNRTLAVNTTAGGEAVLTMTFAPPTPSVSLDVSDTEFSVTVNAYNSSGGLIYSRASAPGDPLVLSLSIAPSEAVASIQVVDGQGDGFVVDNVVYATPPPALTACDRVNQLIQDVEGSGLPQGTERSLVAKLQAAQRCLCDADPSNDASAAGPLGAFQRELSAQSGKKVSPTLAQSLSDGAEVIIDGL